jgi:hypothetical protein
MLDKSLLVRNISKKPKRNALKSVDVWKIIKDEKSIPDVPFHRMEEWTRSLFEKV